MHCSTWPLVNRWAAFALLLGSACLNAGCGGPVADAPAPPAASATREVDPSDAAAAGTDTGSAKPNGDGPATAKPAMEKPADSTAASKTPAPPVESEEPSEPFVAPALADLEARANWIDNPVEDLLAVRRKAEAGQPTPLPAADAVALKNTTRETNAQILGTLGRVAQSNDEIDYEAVLNRHIKADVKSTNPLLSSSVYETDVHALITAGTLTFDRDLRRVGDPDVIVSWQTSSDRLADKLVLRDDLTWSDGQPVTAHDLEFAFGVVMDSRVNVPAVRSSLSRLAGVKAYDDRTVVFFHKDALATNIWSISVPLLPKHIYEKTLAEDPTMEQSAAHVELENNPVVSGPYRLVSRQRGNELLFERREEWYMHNGKQVRDKPHFKTVRLRVITEPAVALLALKKGDVDDLEMTAEQWMQQSNDDEFYELNTKASGVEWTTFMFNWNMETPYFQDARVRRAMGLAFDHKELFETINFGLFDRATGPYHATSWMAPKPGPQPLEQNLDQAEELLDAAGWVDSDGDGIRDREVNGKRIPFEFNIVCTNAPERIRICTLLKGALEQIGVICNVRPLEF
ncbi:MAG: ABC transporter substrate-binding protein, partial [Planctomycetaceae bacterium]